MKLWFCFKYLESDGSDARFCGYADDLDTIEHVITEFVKDEVMTLGVCNIYDEESERVAQFSIKGKTK